MKYPIFVSLLVVLCTSSLSIRSEVTDVSVTPTTINVNINTGITRNLVWTVTLSENDALSRNGEILAPNSIIALESVNQSLLVGAPTNRPPQPVTVNELLTITTNQAQTWWSANIRQLRYRRGFSDGSESSIAAELIINLVEDNRTTTQQGLGAFKVPSNDLRIDRIELRFTDDSKVRFVEQHSLLQAELALSYKGIGTLRGYWQVAGSESIAGDPQFRNLSLVNEHLSALQQNKILSPSLPTNIVGRHYLRFCVTSISQSQLNQTSSTTCPSEIISTTIGYQIFPEKKKTPLIQVLKPDTNFTKPDSLFSWPKIPETQVYQLQILKKREPDSYYSEANLFLSNANHSAKEFVLIRGMILPSSINETVLSNYVINSLVKNEPYFWQISAYNATGQLLAQSKALAIQFN
ncbi:MAG: hypothetical protein KUG78_11235 [Kangiellaceae bacterium]|nr:hypothetical protein [Kangiellaceae bacterium]